MDKPPGPEGRSHQDVQITRAASFKEQRAGSIVRRVPHRYRHYFNVEKRSFFQSSVDGIKVGKHIPFVWLCAAMGNKMTTQDLLLKRRHGMNYSRLKLTIQTRIPLGDGEVTIQPNYGEKQKKQGWVDEAEPQAIQREIKQLRPSLADGRRGRSVWPGPLVRLTETLSPLPGHRAKAKGRATRANRRGHSSLAAGCATFVTDVCDAYWSGYTMDRMRTGERFIFLVPNGAVVRGNRGRISAREYHDAQKSLAYPIPC